MAASKTVAQLRDMILTRADIRNDANVVPAELNALISLSYAELYNVLVGSGLAYFESTQTTVTSGSATIALPSDFRSLLKVEYVVDGEVKAKLRNIHPLETHRVTTNGDRAGWYRTVGTNLVLYPTPPTGQTYILTYIPAPAVLDDDADTIDGVSGWEEFIICDVASQVCLKQDRFEAASFHEARAKMVRQRIQQQVVEREIAGGTSLFLDSGHDYEPDPANWRQYR